MKISYLDSGIQENISWAATEFQYENFENVLDLKKQLCDFESDDNFEMKISGKKGEFHSKTTGKEQSDSDQGQD